MHVLKPPFCMRITFESEFLWGHSAHMNGGTNILFYDRVTNQICYDSANFSFIKWLPGVLKVSDWFYVCIKVGR